MYCALIYQRPIYYLSFTVSWHVKRLLWNKLEFSIINLTSPNEDTCRVAADAAWKVLNQLGNKAYGDYWAKQDPPPNKCKKDCKCSSENYLATFDWDNETMIYENNGSDPGTSIPLLKQPNRAKSSVPGFFALSIALFSSFFVMTDF